MQDQYKKRLVRARSLICGHGKDCARMGGFLRRKDSERGQMGNGGMNGGEVSDMTSHPLSSQSITFYSSIFIVHKLTVCMNEG